MYNIGIVNINIAGVNIVSKTKKRATYHHGDLRRELIEAAMDMLSESGVAGLSLRKLALQVGVSHNAPYMHFSSRDALLAAIAQYGFQKLRASLAPDGEDWHERFVAGCQTYVEFGTTQPELFQVMFMEHDPEAFPEMVQDSLAALQVLTDVIAEGQLLGKIREGDAHEFATLIWSLLHGLSVLFANRNKAPLPYRSDDAADLTETFLDQVLTGLGV